MFFPALKVSAPILGWTVFRWACETANFLWFLG
jgi:hypothetical protein